MDERGGLAAFVHAHNDESDRENIVSDITQLVGWTPLVELKCIAKTEGVDARLVAKMESYQPLSSVKDRSALRMIEDAEKKGLITAGITTLVEPTSGNLEIGLAYIAIRKGYKFIGVMPAHFSLDKRMLLKYLGADVSITDPKLGFQGLVERVEQLKEKDPNVYVLDQITNPANPEAHFDCTGGQPGPHNIQGIGPGFVPQNLDMSLVDEVIAVPTNEAMVYARRIAREEGFLVGISSGANLAACMKVAERVENRGKMIVTMFSSGGERYMSTQLFDEVREECAKMSF